MNVIMEHRGVFFPAKAVTIWRWQDAPEDFKALSTHGGDEDFVAFVPDSLRHAYLPFLDQLGVCRTSEHTVTGGAVFIGAHA